MTWILDITNFICLCNQARLKNVFHSLIWLNFTRPKSRMYWTTILSFSLINYSSDTGRFSVNVKIGKKNTYQVNIFGRTDDFTKLIYYIVVNCKKLRPKFKRFCWYISCCHEAGDLELYHKQNLYRQIN